MRAIPLAAALLLAGCTVPERPASGDRGAPVTVATAPAMPTPRAASASAPAAPARPVPAPSSATSPATSPTARPAGPASAPARCQAAGLRDRFTRCRAARDQAGCQAAGGTWGPQGVAVNPTCACPTGQGGCPCRRDRDCLAGCRAPMALNAARANRCRAMWSSCAPTWPALGCWCWFGEDGQPVERCTD